MSNQVHSLWIGTKLTELELLTLYSFKKHGHNIKLWAYKKIENLPDFVKQFNANTIIPEEKVFKYDKHSKIDWGKGSYAGFSDVFRYKLLYEQGGWWVDMDVTCLKPFKITMPYFFRNHWKFDVVGNIMKCPKGSQLMKDCYKRALKEVNEHNTNWHKPIEILNEEIEKLQLEHYIQKGLFNLDMKHTITPYLNNNYPFPKDWLGVHWINSQGRLNYKKNSTFNQLLNKYEIREKQHNYKWFMG